MGTTLKATFETRREAEMTVERLVQEYGIERTDIFVAAEGAENSAGEEEAGSDTAAGSPTTDDRNDAALNGRISVSVDLDDEARADEVRSAFSEFDAQSISD